MNSSPLSFVRQSTDSVRQAFKRQLCRWTKADNQDLALDAAMDPTRSQPELGLENMLLGRQLIALERQVNRPTLTWRDRALFVLLANQRYSGQPDPPDLAETQDSPIIGRPTEV